MKKTLTMITLLLLSLTNTSFAIDLDAWTWDTTNTEVSVVEIGEITVIAWKNSVEANWEDTIPLDIIVDSIDWVWLTDEQINLAIDVKDNNGSIENITYSPTEEVFKTKYISWNEVWSVTLIITATSNSDESVTLQSIFSDISLTEVIEKAIEADVISLEDSFVDEWLEEEVLEIQNEEKTLEANIISSEMLGENRIKVSFDIEISIPEENPMNSVTIETIEEKEKVKISNIVLGEDSKSVIISTENNLEDEAYRVIINEVLNKSTMKKATLVNTETTVTGTSEIIMVVLALLLSTMFIYFSRRKA